MTDLSRSRDAPRAGRRFKRLLRFVGRITGLSSREEVLADLPPVDLRGLDLCPAESLLRAGEARVVIDVPVEDCRGHRAAAFPCTPGAGHPYLETAIALLARPDLDFPDSPLARFYRRFQPKTAAELLGVDPRAPQFQGPPESMMFPWELPRPANARRSRRRLARENRSHGLGPAGHGFHHFGPVSDEKGRLEIRRLRDILACLRAEGFRLLPGPDGVCTARILAVGDAWRAVIVNGQHRVAAAAALGERTVPLSPLRDIVRRDQVDSWPAVRAGLYDRADALAVFDRVYAGRQPAAMTAALRAA